MQGEGTWIWFEDEVRGPYPTWEAELVASKCRHFLVCDSDGRWVRYADWDRRPVSVPQPLPPPRRFALAASRTLFRRLLRVHHQMRPYFVIGQYRDRPAEGMQVLTRAVADGLRREGRAVQVFEPTRMVAQLWQALRRQPAAIIFTHGPGTRAVFMSALLGRLTRARIVWLAPRPDLAGCPRALAALARVDLVLSSRMAPDLAAIVQGCGALFVKTVHGVDRDRFRPLPALADGDRAAALGLQGPPRRPILLHVGHIRPNRGLELLVETKRRLVDHADLVVFGSPTFPPDQSLLDALRGVGAIVQVGFTPDLARVYGAADLYLFPATDSQGGAIDLPLSVLEALAVGVLVLTTPFGATRDVLASVPGVTFAEPHEFAARCADLLQAPSTSARPVASLPREFDLSRLAGKVVRMVEAAS